MPRRDHTPAEVPEPEHQEIRRMPDEENQVGPFFPSGMGREEAAMAGATAGMSDDDKDEIEYQKKVHGIE